MVIRFHSPATISNARGTIGAVTALAGTLAILSRQSNQSNEVTVSYAIEQWEL